MNPAWVMKASYVKSDCNCELAGPSQNWFKQKSCTGYAVQGGAFFHSQFPVVEHLEPLSKRRKS